MKRASIDLVLFDMDGVIFEGKNFWLDLHRAYDTEDEGVRLAKEFMLDDYDQLAEMVAGRLWKGKPAADYWRLIAEREYSAGVVEVFAFLHANHVKTGIVSSGPYELALRAQGDLGIDEVRANRIHVADGFLTGAVDLGVRESEKAEVGRQIAEALGSNLQRAAYVADSESDASLAREVVLPVAYNTTSVELRMLAGEHTLEKGRLVDLIGVLRPYLPAPRELMHGNRQVSRQVRGRH